MSKPTGKLIRLTAGDVGAYTKAEADTKIADAKKAGTDAQATANAANTAATNANSNANGRIPSTRKVNNKPLSADISLGAGDVGAYTKAETDTKVADAKKAGTDAQATANAANTAANNANNNANGRVPSGRKVNNKPLSADISLGAGDVGAYTKAEVDSKLAAGSGLGYGQKWQDVTANRKYNTTYTNTTGKPIMIYLVGSTVSNHELVITLDGITCNHFNFTNTGQNIDISLVIPPSGTYSFNGKGVRAGYFKWLELRA